MSAPSLRFGGGRFPGAGAGAGARALALLVRAYPADFRAEYGAELVRDYAELRRAGPRTPTARPTARRCWPRWRSGCCTS